ncbi:MAG: MIP/aquaporin family protein [Thermoleophilaceae bacterium]
MQDRGPAAYIAEFIGTAALVFFITAVVSNFNTAASPTNPNPFIDWSVIGLVHVLILFVLIQTLAVISGAHFNPAITAALTVLRQIKPPDAGIYILAQLAGAVAGALLTKALLTDFANAHQVHFGATAVSGRLGDKTGLGMLAEGLGTFILVWAVVGVAVSPRAAKDWAALAIGGALGLAVMVVGPLTGAGLNPARAFGPALVANAFNGAGKFILVFVVAPVIGGVLAALLYDRVLLAPGATGEKPMEPVG